MICQIVVEAVQGGLTDEQAKGIFGLILIGLIIVACYKLNESIGGYQRQRGRKARERTLTELTAYVSEGTGSAAFAKTVCEMDISEERKREVAAQCAEGALTEDAALTLLRTKVEVS